MPPPNTPDDVLSDQGDSNTLTFIEPDQPSETETTAAMRTARTTEPQTAPSQRGPVILPLDYQILDYADTVDETLLCPVCRTAFHSPIITSCGHTFCATCINRALEVQPTCPIDRKPINKTIDFHQPPLIIKEQLDRLKVKCPNKGCDQICSREHLEGHYEHRCEYTQVLCPSLRCDKRIARRYLTTECMHHQEPCEYCGESVAEVDLADHYDYVCTGASSRCEWCEAAVVHHRLEKHIQEDCPETEVDCKWFPIGCKVSDKRFKVVEHEQDCPYEIIGRLVRERTEDRKLIDSLVDRINALENQANDRHDRRARRSHRDFLLPPSSMGLNGAADDLESLRSSSSPESYMLARFERLEMRMEDLTKQLQELDAYQSSFVLQQLYPINNQLVELASKVGVLNMHTTWLMNMQRLQQRTGSTVNLSNSNMPSANDSPRQDFGTRPEFPDRQAFPIVNLPLRGLVDEPGSQYFRADDRRSSIGRDMNASRL
ncbi:hypothetical protein QBC38DRAFT_375010 [Podospora fimiseda]|uniref:Uncharacterized protein n=1 Tax=Podospora fimiseda TaxID=252190 RepID=A0AAN6YNF2_9PEZI|nr:hypothetical protein QBC38DRAFT_375010 [Podospora fimiseda]